MKWVNIGFKVLIYISLLFLAWYLWQFDYIQLRSVEIDYAWGTLSIALLFGGFVLSTVSWRYALYYHSIKIPVRTALISHGLAVFAKYIPGKIWVILGRASYVSQQTGQLKKTSFISLKEQLLYILLGLLISLVPSILYFKINYLVILLLGTIVVLTLILFNSKAHLLAETLLSKVFKREFTIPGFESMLAVKLCGVILIYWLFWTLGFYALNRAVLGPVGMVTAFALPLSVCYGVLAIIAPGGLGVREGIIVAFLVAAGITVEQAVTLSIIARLWFIIGELFLFVLAIVLKAFAAGK